MYKFFVTENQVNNGIIDIVEDDVNHIKNVLRLGVEERIEICDISHSINYLCEIMEHKPMPCGNVKSHLCVYGVRNKI